jgi:hypothetical protein
MSQAFVAHVPLFRHFPGIPGRAVRQRFKMGATSREPRHGYVIDRLDGDRTALYGL